jgi:hypothetical protein
MTLRSLILLVLVTVATVIAAAVAVLGRDRPETAVAAGERLFPDLADRIDRLAALGVRNRNGTVTIRRGETGWELVERAGYPVSFEKVRETVLGLATLEKVEAKTRRPDLYPRLGVEPPDAEGAASRELSLLDADGGVIARLIVGKPVFGLGGEGGLYVRLPDEDRAWAVRGSLDPGDEPRDWVERTLLDLEAGDIVRIAVTHPDGERLTIVREPEAGGPLALAGIPPGRRLARADELRALASVVADLSLEDFRPASEVAVVEEKAVRARFLRRDGLAVAMTVADAEDGKWLVVEAEVDYSAAAARAEQTSGTDDAAQEAARINARAGGWAFKVLSWKVGPLLKRAADLTEPGEPGS